MSIYQDATNNGAESCHKTLKSIIKTPHPNVWKLIACLDNIISTMTPSYRDYLKI